MKKSDSTLLIAVLFIAIFFFSGSSTGNFALTQMPKGSFDWVDEHCSIVAGWTCDPSNYNEALEVLIYDGPAKYGYIVATGIANLERENAVGEKCGGNNFHGYFIELPDSVKDGKRHDFHVYAVNIPKGPRPQLQGSPKRITCPLME